jgi:transcriptional regulator with XRE-family HTH domain
MKKAKKRNPRVATSIDAYIAAQIRAHRIALGLSQADLARTLGVSFQQIQKYESGTNRVSASRLFDICKTLKVPLPACLSAIRRFNA